MNEFNDTVRISDLPEAAEGQTLIVPAVDGEGNTVKKDLGPTIAAVKDNGNAISEMSSRITTLAEQMCLPLCLVMYRSGIEVESNDSGKKGGNKEQSEKQDSELGVSLPGNFTVRVSHKPCERNSGKRQHLEYSTDCGKTWTVFEPTGNLTLSPEDQESMENMLAAIYSNGYVEIEDPVSGTKHFESEEEVEEYFEPKRNERVDIEVAADGALLLRGECETLEGFNISTLKAEGRILPSEVEETYDVSLKKLEDIVSLHKPFWLVFAVSKDDLLPTDCGKFDNLPDAEDCCDLIEGKSWIVTDKATFEAMWDEFREAAEMVVPFACSGDILSLMDWKTPDPEAAAEVPFVFAGLFENSTIAVGPELPAVLGEGTWARFYGGCDYLRELGARWCIAEWVRMARSGIGRTFATYKWLEGAFGKKDDDVALKLKWDEAATTLLEEIAGMSEREQESMTAGLTVKPLDTNDVLGERLDKVEHIASKLEEAQDALLADYWANPRIVNFAIPNFAYDKNSGMITWTAQNTVGYMARGGVAYPLTSIVFFRYIENGVPLKTEAVNPALCAYEIGDADRIYATASLVDGETGNTVWTPLQVVWDKGLHSKEEIMSWVGAVFHYKGHKATVADLPAEDNEVGDTWNVRSTGANYAWDGEAWDKLSETVDLSGVAMSADLAGVATSGSYNDLSDKPTIPAAQEQADWNQSDPTAADYIKNKPTIPAAGSQVHQVTAVELAAAQTGGTISAGDWYFVTDSGNKSLSLGLDTATVQTIWTEQV